MLSRVPFHAPGPNLAHLFYRRAIRFRRRFLYAVHSWRGGITHNRRRPPRRLVDEPEMRFRRRVAGMLDEQAVGVTQDNRQNIVQFMRNDR